MQIYKRLVKIIQFETDLKRWGGGGGERDQIPHLTPMYMYTFNGLKIGFRVICFKWSPVSDTIYDLLHNLWKSIHVYYSNV